MFQHIIFAGAHKTRDCTYKRAHIVHIRNIEKREYTNTRARLWINETLIYGTLSRAQTHSFQRLTAAAAQSSPRFEEIAIFFYFHFLQ